MECPPSFGVSVNPFGLRGADYAHRITTGSPIFLDDAASITNVKKCYFYAKIPVESSEVEEFKNDRQMFAF